MPMTLRLTDDEPDPLCRRADVVRQAIGEYMDNHSRADLLDQVLDEELPRYSEALERFDR